MDIKSEFKTMLKLDKEWSHFIRIKNLRPSLRRASEIVTLSGESKWEWIALVILWIIGNTFWKEWAITVAIGLGLLTIVQLPIKRLVDRQRPIGLRDRKTREKS